MRIEEIIARKIEDRLEAKLDGILDRVLDNVLEKAVEGALARILGVELTESEPKAKAKAKGKGKAKAKAEDEVKAEATEPAPTELAPKAEAAPTEPAPKAESEPTEPASPTAEDQLLARLKRVASKLGEEKYGPMLLRRAKAITKHALNPRGALAVLVAWAEQSPAEEVIAVLRGSERLPDGGTLSGWKLMASRLGIPVQEKAKA